MNLVTLLEKCILVCANCHRELEYKYIDSRLIPKPATLITKICQQCNQEFQTIREQRKYCSEACFRLTRRRCERPTKEQLSVLIDENSWVKLGRMFGVSDNAVRKWARKYGLIPSR